MPLMLCPPHCFESLSLLFPGSGMARRSIVADEDHLRNRHPPARFCLSGTCCFSVEYFFLSPRLSWFASRLGKFPVATRASPFTAGRPSSPSRVIPGPGKPDPSLSPAESVFRFLCYCRRAGWRKKRIPSRRRRFERSRPCVREPCGKIFVPHRFASDKRIHCAACCPWIAAPAGLKCTASSY
jgi:hypothetical protein